MNDYKNLIKELEMDVEYELLGSLFKTKEDLTSWKALDAIKHLLQERKELLDMMDQMRQQAAVQANKTKVVSFDYCDEGTNRGRWA